MFKVVQEGVAGGAAGSMLDEIVRDGARQMLASALQAEVAAYVQAHAGQVDERGHRLVVRNGSALAREVVTGAGAVTVAALRVNDKRVDPVTGVRQRFPRRFCRRGRVSPARSRRCCRCCICMGCPVWISVRRWSSSSGRGRGCRRRRSPG